MVTVIRAIWWPWGGGVDAHEQSNPAVPAAHITAFPIERIWHLKDT